MVKIERANKFVNKIKEREWDHSRKRKKIKFMGNIKMKSCANWWEGQKD